MQNAKLKITEQNSKLDIKVRLINFEDFAF
jgi:hypothetical protein